MSTAKRAWPILGLLILLGAAVGFALASNAFHLRFGIGARWLITALVAFPAGWLALKYWRGIDELAREAQKTAWYWGGSLGMGVGLLAISAAAGPKRPLAYLIPADWTAHQGLFAGAVVVLVAQLIGFHVMWAYWWWTKR